MLWNKQYVALWEAYLLGRRWQKGNRPESADFGQTRGGGLSGGNSGGLPHQRGIPGAAECQRDGKDRAETVNNIPHKQKRNPVGVLFQVLLLYPAGQGGAGDVEYGTAAVDIFLPDTHPMKRAGYFSPFLGGKKV